MSLQQWLGIGAGILLVGFIVFAFRQGQKVKPGHNPDDSLAGGGPGSDASGMGGAPGP